MTTATTRPRRAAPQRGRPSVVDRRAIAAAVLPLWSAHGVRGTTWPDIAAATGASVRTLMRHFPTQTDIAWVGVPDAVDRLRRALEAAPPAASPMDAIRDGVRASVVDPAVDAGTTDVWLRLVAGDPQLRGASFEGWQPWTQALGAYLADRVPEASPGLCDALAAAVQAAAFTAMLQAPDDRARAVDRTLRALDFRFPTPSKDTP